MAPVGEAHNHNVEPLNQIGTTACQIRGGNLAGQVNTPSAIDFTFLMEDSRVLEGPDAANGMSRTR